MANQRIKKIKLSNGQIYSIFDEGALRLNEDDVLLTGNEIVDKVILQGQLYITEVDDVAVDAYTSVLVKGADGLVASAPKDRLLSDIGGVSAFVENSGVLSLKIGK